MPNLKRYYNILPRIGEKKVLCIYLNSEKKIMHIYAYKCKVLPIVTK